MARIPKHLLTRSITPGWVYTVEALILTLLVYGALLCFAGYQPGKRTPAARNSPGVTLLTRSGVPAAEWRKLLAWTRVHDPAQVSRADARSGYATLLEKHRPRRIDRRPKEEPAVIPAEPRLPTLPGYAALSPIPEPEEAPYRDAPFEERSVVPLPAVREPFIMDASGHPGKLPRLRMPEQVGTDPPAGPTVVTVWERNGLRRAHLARSCGVAAFDQAALEAAAGEAGESRQSIVIYWPEKGKEEEEAAP